MKTKSSWDFFSIWNEFKLISFSENLSVKRADHHQRENVLEISAGGTDMLLDVGKPELLESWVLSLGM